MNSTLYTLLAVGGVSIISVIGIIFLSMKKSLLTKIISYLIALSVGVLLADVFIHILPEVYHSSVEGHMHSIWPSVYILIGIVLFFIVEKIFHWRHCHHLPNETHVHPVGWVNLIGDGMHNFFDGMLIAGSFMVSPEIGIATTIAVLLHEIPQEIGDFATLIHAGFSTRKALLANFVASLLAFLGAGIVIVLNASIEGISEIILPLTAGSFLYIAASDLIPILHKQNTLKESIGQTIMILIGIGLMVGVVFLEMHSH